MLIRKTVVHEWIGGARFFASKGETGLTGSIYTGLHEFPEMAFEPVPDTFNRLVENTRLNHIETRVTCHNLGLGESIGKLRFTGDRDTMNHVLADHEACDKAIEVPVARLDEMLAGETAILMKVDVEGFETVVLRGAQKSLNDPKLQAVIMELNGSGSRYGFDESEILAMMSTLGFKAFSYEPFARALIALTGKDTSSGNTIFIRDLEFVEARVRAASKVSVLGESV